MRAQHTAVAPAATATQGSPCHGRWWRHHTHHAARRTSAHAHAHWRPAAHHVGRRRHHVHTTRCHGRWRHSPRHHVLHATHGRRWHAPRRRRHTHHPAKPIRWATRHPVHVARGRPAPATRACGTRRHATSRAERHRVYAAGKHCVWLEPASHWRVVGSKQTFCVGVQRGTEWMSARVVSVEHASNRATCTHTHTRTCCRAVPLSRRVLVVRVLNDDRLVGKVLRGGGRTHSVGQQWWWREVLRNRAATRVQHESTVVGAYLLVHALDGQVRRLEAVVVDEAKAAR